MKTALFALPKTDSFSIGFTDETSLRPIQELCREVYPFSIPWSLEQLRSHQKVFPEGQLVAKETATGKIVGMAASLIIFWDDYDIDQPWREFTDQGWFTNHDPTHGRTLYGAEIMVHPDFRGPGVGKLLYSARRRITEHFGLLRIRSGARLRGYSTYAKELSPQEYLRKVRDGELFDSTVSFQLKQGFKILKLISGYLKQDPESLGYAALIEWLNPKIAKLEDFQHQHEMSCRI